MSAAFLPGLALAAALAPAEAQTFRFHADHVLGTSFDMAVAASGEAAAQVAFAAARGEIARLDRALSGWRPDSELAALNAAETMQVSPDLFAVIAACETWRARTGGAFDARVGEGCAQAPRLDAAARTITRPAGLRFEIDGLAKGYAIDAALSAARRAAPCLSGLMIDIGGDVGCWGRAWTVGVANPAELQDNAPPAARIAVSNQGLAVSGPGLRDRMVDGEAQSHLIDRRTGRSAPRRQAAVLAPTALEADALSTALAVLPTAEALALAEATPGVEALLFDIDNAPRATSGWAACQAAAPLPAGFAVEVSYELPKQEVANYKRPYVVVWVTDADKVLVKTLLVAGGRQEWQEDNYVWWRRYGRKIPGVVEAMAKPTRAPGKYSVGWDGTDQDGRRMPQGAYIVHIEAAREHGGHAYQTIEVILGAKPVAGAAAGKDELGAAQLRYAKRK